MTEKDVVDIRGLDEEEIRRRVGTIIDSHAGRGALNVINAKCNASLKDYIRTRTEFLDELGWASFQTRCYAFASGIMSADQLPKCETCGQTIRANVASVRAGFRRRTCSRRCAARSESRNAKRKDTMVRTYGDENWNNREKYRSTCMERYGVACSLQDPGAARKSKKTRLERHGDENWNNREKAARTCLEKYGAMSDGRAISNGKARKLGEDPDYYKKISEKGKATRLARHGDENWNNREKAGATTTERHGTPTWNNREKAAATCLRKYGVDNPARAGAFREKSRNTCLRRYCVDNAAKAPETRTKAELTSLQKFGAIHYAKTGYARLKTSIRRNAECFNRIASSTENRAAALFSFQEFRNRAGGAALRWRCLDCGAEFYAPVNFIYARQSGTYARCPSCHPAPKSGSDEQRQVEEYVRSIYGGEVRTNDRTAIRPLEIDAFMPGIMAGVEFDGLYWHSAVWRSDLLHMSEKSRACESRGIKLAHVLEDEWRSFRAQTEWRIRQIICAGAAWKPAGMTLREIPDRQFERFMSGNSNDKYARRGKAKFGAFSGGRLVFAASATKYRDKAVIRTLQGAIGADCSDAVPLLVEMLRAKYGAARLFARLDNRYPYDAPLLRAGFRLVKITAPAEWIIDAKKWKRLPRRAYGKIKDDARKSGMHEIDYLHKAGMTAMYDCGQRVYELAGSEETGMQP